MGSPEKSYLHKTTQIIHSACEPNNQTDIPASALIRAAVSRVQLLQRTETELEASVFGGLCPARAGAGHVHVQGQMHCALLQVLHPIAHRYGRVCVHDGRRTGTLEAADRCSRSGIPLTYQRVSRVHDRDRASM